MKLTIPQSEFNWIPTSVSARNTYTQCPRKWWLQYRTDTPKNEGNKKAEDYFGMREAFDNNESKEPKEKAEKKVDTFEVNYEGGDDFL